MLRPRPLAVLAGFILASCGPGGRWAEPLGTVSEALNVCGSSVVEGVDVFDGQGSIGWTQVADAGRAFAFIKASQGNYDTQTTFAADWAGAQDAGILRSPYHFFDGTIDGVAQAQYFLSVVQSGGGFEEGDLPPLLDLECPTSSTSGSANPDCEYTGNSGYVPTATLSQRVYDWISTVETATGRVPIIYSYPSWFSDVGFTDAQLAQYPLFIASYNTCANVDVPAPWTTTVFWQYSASGTVAGINGQVDLDRFIGTQAQLVAFANGPGPDGGSLDAGGSDAGEADAGPADAGPGMPDAGSIRGEDGGVPAVDGGGEGDGGGMTRGGCGCGSRPGAANGWEGALLLAAVVGLLRAFGHAPVSAPPDGDGVAQRPRNP